MNNKWMEWSLSSTTALGEAGTVASLTLGLVEGAGGQRHHDIPFQAVNVQTLAVHLFHYFSRAERTLEGVGPKLYGRRSGVSAAARRVRIHVSRRQGLSGTVLQKNNKASAAPSS